MNKPGKYDSHDPHRRLLAAVVLRAVRDIQHKDYGRSARLFLAECSGLSAEFAGVSEPKLRQLLEAA